MKQTTYLAFIVFAALFVTPMNGQPNPIRRYGRAPQRTDRYPQYGVVNLSLKLETNHAAIGDLIRIGVFAKLGRPTDATFNGKISSISQIVLWDKRIFAFVAADDSQNTYQWLRSGMLPDSVDDNLNGDLTDGDGVYVALSNFNSFFDVSGGKQRVTTLVFRIKAEGNGYINTPITRRKHTVTTVFGDKIPGASIIGSTNNMFFRIGNGNITGHALVVKPMKPRGPVQSPRPRNPNAPPLNGTNLPAVEKCPEDINGDGKVDVNDIRLVLDKLGQTCKK